MKRFLDNPLIDDKLHRLECGAMTLIEALLLLPEHGEPEVVGREVARVLNGSSAGLARRHGTRWSLTDTGRRFLAQFRQDGSYVVTQVVVRLVIEDGVPVFHIPAMTARC